MTSVGASKLLVRGGNVVTCDGRRELDVLCVDGRIAAFGAPDDTSLRRSADEVLDVTGLLVFPGFIDPHVHSRDPGMTHKEDFAHSTLGALAGGLTMLLEMPNAIPPVSDIATLEERRARHETVASVDFGLWAISLGSANLDQVEPLFAAGVVGIKLFWGYALSKETRQLIYNVGDEPPDNILLPPTNGEVLELFARVARVNGLLAAHCEDRDILLKSQEALGREIETYEDLLASRPATAEAASVALGAEFSSATGCRFHVLHMASRSAVEALRSAHRRGIPITGETCPHYLTLSDASYPEVGPVMKVYPPVRTIDDQGALWEGIDDGVIVSVGSDHAPHTVEEKGKPLSTMPAGAVGVETLVPVLLNEMANGRISPERLAGLLSTSTARLYGIYPGKGAIELGSDADLTIVDPEATRTVDNASLHAKEPLSPWHGVALTGVPTVSLLRGEVLMRDGEPVGPPRGRFVPARHSHGVEM